MKTPFHHARFLLGAHRLAQLPPDTGVEIAFAGRSNAGKSSALNALTGQKKLARTSKTPGLTQQINIFTINEEQRLADLPGYGYAKVPRKMQQHWQKTLGNYLQTRQSLQGLCLIMDIRHPFTPQDGQLLDWCRQVEMPVHILLTKADKLSRNQARQALMQAQSHIDREYPLTTVQIFSATKKTGIEEAQQTLLLWLESGTEKGPDYKGNETGA
ncbi:MAG: ribosome biogenesis GTP-binding protein YihA/YsxC [Gammaproteobacteria bacterium]|nr:MAG: ribosome biogenesis GTP-binding protein YihA/YsxC [Gammaproteobacteria bacterium]